MGNHGNPAATSDFQRAVVRHLGFVRPGKATLEACTFFFDCVENCPTKSIKVKAGAGRPIPVSFDELSDVEEVEPPVR